jgi:hypothetical protein
MLFWGQEAEERAIASKVIPAVESAAGTAQGALSLSGESYAGHTRADV